MTKTILKVIIVLVIFFASCVLVDCQFLEAQQPIPNPIENQHSTDTRGTIPNPIEDPQPIDIAGGLLSYAFSIGPFLLISVIGFFLINYFIIVLGLKILKIKEIPKSKIILYVFIMFIVGFILQLATNNIIFLKNLDTVLIYLINSLISFGITLVVIKYYFLLSGKKLWIFFLYLIAVNLLLRLLF